MTINRTMTIVWPHFGTWPRCSAWTGNRCATMSPRCCGTPPRLPLPELLLAHPPQSGAVEVLGYVQIAHEDGHHIDSRVIETIRLGDAPPDEADLDAGELYDVPRVVFLSRELRELARGLNSQGAP